jgi:hypothetical protein
VGKISNIAEAVGRADLVLLIAAHDMLSSTNSPWNYQGPFWLPSLTGVLIKKKGGGCQRGKDGINCTSSIELVGVPIRQGWQELSPITFCHGVQLANQADDLLSWA